MSSGKRSSGRLLNRSHGQQAQQSRCKIEGKQKQAPLGARAATTARPPQRPGRSVRRRTAASAPTAQPRRRPAHRCRLCHMSAPGFPQTKCSISSGLRHSAVAFALLRLAALQLQAPRPRSCHASACARWRLASENCRISATFMAACGEMCTGREEEVVQVQHL